MGDAIALLSAGDSIQSLVFSGLFAGDVSPFFQKRKAQDRAFVLRKRAVLERKSVFWEMKGGDW